MPISNQMSAGAGKAAKFVAANPLGPMANPFEGLDDGQEEYQRAVSENVNKRLTKAMGEIQERHDRGTNEVDDLDRAPTGTAYREVHRLNAERSRAALASAEEEKGRKRREAGDVRRLRDEVRRKNFAGGEGGGMMTNPAGATTTTTTNTITCLTTTRSWRRYGIAGSAR